MSGSLLHSPQFYKSYGIAERRKTAQTCGSNDNPWDYYHSHRWEEHWGGHRARGNNRIQAQNAALNLCYRHHGHCRINRCRIL